MPASMFSRISWMLGMELICFSRQQIHLFNQVVGKGLCQRDLRGIYQQILLESLLYLTKEPSLCINPPNFPKQYDPLHPTPTLTNMILISMPIDQSSTGWLRCQVFFKSINVCVRARANKLISLRIWLYITRSKKPTP